MKQGIQPQLVEELRRLRPLFTLDTFESAVAAAVVIDLHALEFPDGYIVNPDAGHTVLGHRDIAIIVARLSGFDEDEVYAQLAASDVDWQPAYDRIISELSAWPGVRLR